jgi:hypothetical protein
LANSTWTKYKNLVIFLKIWSNYGYWKPQKALDFSIVNFKNITTS